MVKHPRPASKRKTTRHRAKVVRKVREHDRKQRKASKTGHKKGKKDPGVPASFPQKEAFLEQLAADRETEREYQRAQRTEAEKLRDLMADAEGRAAVYRKLGKEDEEKSKIVAVVPDSSRKAYFKEFRAVVEASDVILEVLDARDPQGCRVAEVEEAVRASGKRLVLVLNKTDLVPADVLRKWLAHFRRSLPAVAFRASVNSQKSGLGTTRTSDDAVGADQLVALLKNYARSANLKTTVTVGVVGYPNVGKSSLINSLKRSKVCRVGATPGVTTVAQHVHLDRNISLLDCPGIVFSTSKDAADGLFLRNVLKVEQLDDPTAPIAAILQRVPRDSLTVAFGCVWPEDAEDQAAAFLRAVAVAHGRLRKGGIPDCESAARHVLNEWNAGKIKYWHEPPAAAATTASDSVALVTELAPEFKLEGFEEWLGRHDAMEVDDN